MVTLTECKTVATRDEILSINDLLDAEEEAEAEARQRAERR